MIKKLALLSALLGIFLPAAQAEVTINGFASVVSGIDLEDDGNPTNDYGSRTVDNLQESKVALQWTADLGDGMRFVGQTMARGNSSDGFVLNYDWAYFDFNVGDSGKLKFGRLRIPFYKYSDYLDVGYAYHWIAPPKSMYSLAFSNVDGIGYQQNFVTGGIEHSINAVLGRYQGTLQLGGNDAPGDLQNLIAINYSVTAGNHEFYAAYAQADTYITTPFTARDQALDGDLGRFLGAGYKGSFGPIGLFAEASQVTVDDSILQDSTGYYLGGSYTLGDMVYHITYEAEEDEGKTYANAGTTLVAKNLGNRSSEGEASTITLGVRKDIGMTTAVKFEISSYTEDRYQGNTSNPPTSLATAKSEQKALLLRAAVETMF
ncbi:porin [Bermanella marisrubri]|uniref:Uncharacterized protein n=1 Tax=Bermanella marisrubri TaxID=207949 RepID=Q1N6S3_9GAMM|nr:porin [Bermanella marisrubri]EAT13519.1 hypothetical protein RED65_09014 [Oceanobacter sp. RED65] [Bermanella marisrubri]QIZ84319.1 porin [Bermanella marisrubri]